MTADALARFQDWFARALLDPSAPADPAIRPLLAQPAFAVYRNTALKGAIDALQANYPAVARLVGDEWFRAAAAVHARNAPPSHPALLDYGAGFADFLAGFEPAEKLPYLAAVARLDRLWTEAHAAADHATLDPRAVARLAPGAFAGAILEPHPAARWAWFPDCPAYTIWRHNRVGEPLEGEIDWRGEGALLTRPRGTVEWIALDAAGCAFLDACAAGHTLDRAAASALAAQGSADLARLMSDLLAAGTFSRMSRTPGDPLKEEQR